MRFSKISSVAQALLNELVAASAVWIGRTEKVAEAMRKAAVCKEPALIPELVSFLFDDNAGVVLATEDALAALYAEMPAASLSALDEAMRASWGGPYQAKEALRWRRMAPEQVNALARPDPVRSALLLGLACCHASGYVRRNAVACLEQQVVFPR